MKYRDGFGHLEWGRLEKLCVIKFIIGESDTKYLVIIERLVGQFQNIYIPKLIYTIKKHGVQTPSSQSRKRTIFSLCSHARPQHVWVGFKRIYLCLHAGPVPGYFAPPSKTNCLYFSKYESIFHFYILYVVMFILKQNV